MNHNIGADPMVVGVVPVVVELDQQLGQVNVHSTIVPTVFMNCYRTQSIAVYV